MKFRSELAGVFTLKIHGGDRGEIDAGTMLGHKNGEIGNLILDQGIRHILQNHSVDNASYSVVRVGTGNSSPQVDQTGLDAVVAVKAAGNAGVATFGYNIAGGYQWRKYEVQFAQGAAAGNLSEIGAGWGTGATQVFSRALIVDGAGNPTTITVLENEYLTVTYELRRWWTPAPDAIVTYDDDGTPNTTTAVSNKAHTTAQLAMAGAPYSTVFVPSSTALTVTYDHAKIDQGVCGVNINYGLGAGNPQITGIVTSALGATQSFTPSGDLFTFTPPIPKTNEFTVDIKIDLSFARRA